MEENAEERKFWRKIRELSKNPHMEHKLDDADIHRYVQYLQTWESCNMSRKETLINIQDVGQLSAEHKAIAKSDTEKKQERDAEQ